VVHNTTSREEGTEKTFQWDVFKQNFDPENGEHLKDLMAHKKYFILSFWRHKFPNHPIDDYDKLLKIINNSSSLQRWYSETSNLYGYYHEQPSWVLSDPDLRDKWLTDSSSVFETFKNSRKELMNRRKRLVASIEAELAEVEKLEESLVTKFYSDYPLVAINKIPVQGLPEERYIKHLGKIGDNHEKALTQELESYKGELAKKYIIENGEISELIDKLKGQI
jgi:hypothetical protein